MSELSSDAEVRSQTSPKTGLGSGLQLVWSVVLQMGRTGPVVWSLLLGREDQQDWSKTGQDRSSGATLTMHSPCGLGHSYG
jgi:hypothetical protein